MYQSMPEKDVVYVLQHNIHVTLGLDFPSPSERGKSSVPNGTRPKVPE